MNSVLVLNREQWRIENPEKSHQHRHFLIWMLYLMGIVCGIALRSLSLEVENALRVEFLLLIQVLTIWIGVYVAEKWYFRMPTALVVR